MFSLGFVEILVILAVALLVMGPEKLPEAARTIGRTIGGLRRTVDEFSREFTLPQVDLERELLEDDSDETPSVQQSRPSETLAQEENADKDETP